MTKVRTLFAYLTLGGIVNHVTLWIFSSPTTTKVVVGPKTCGFCQNGGAGVGGTVLVACQLRFFSVEGWGRLHCLADQNFSLLSEWPSHSYKVSFKLFNNSKIPLKSCYCALENCFSVNHFYLKNDTRRNLINCSWYIWQIGTKTVLIVLALKT